MKKSKIFMDTVIDIEVVTRKSTDEAEAAIDRAFAAFRKVEQACSRFSPDSELMMACQQYEAPVPISPFLFEPLRFALEVAKRTNGKFDPAIGATMTAHGFDRHYLTGDIMHGPPSDSATYRDIMLNDRNRTLYLRKPLTIDLGAVAKGFAVDLASHELKRYEGFVVNAGGDLYAGGADENGDSWKIGIQHPIYEDGLIQTVGLSNEAVCTSGSYERRNAAKAGMHHMIAPITKQSPNEWISCSVIAPYAMMADAFATAVFLLGLERGKRLLEQLGLKGILITPHLYRLN
ncbi:FAD:protein FMN transferase [Paenibacillus thalictri]|uniref:FAD:protein FMN transferase n=1 Tax=Paenibacillus thalictri TaxID=2527873 RepID=A0A4Q9DRV2_9BACL|nr:FAD:protein FMN transferase [Paenibacillus thalictri]TBL76454.1 FAD:protein FMN transferase [Paenibacillus thalictri]